ncbi:MAG: heat-inducible transcriptional repressor HrcA [Microbacterium sp.]
MVSDRGLEVLRAIVQDYVSSNEPVGSKTIVDRHAFGVSAATIRNDMAQLEDEELIVQPHTSSGRVPTDKGYRVFVDHLAQLRPLTTAQRQAIATFLADPADLDDLLARTVRLLTQITGHVALVQYPSFARANVTHLQVVALDAHRALVIIVTDTGRVSQRVVESAEPLDADALSAAANALVPLVVDRSVADSAELLSGGGLDDLVAPAHQTVLEAIARAVAGELDEFRQNKLVMAGTPTLARWEQDFRGSILPLLEAIEEQVTLLRLMSEMVADGQGMSASIGRENAQFGLAEATILASDYGDPDRARVGVMGPMRMDYPRNLAAVRAVARYLTRQLDENEGRR